MLTGIPVSLRTLWHVIAIRVIHPLLRNSGRQLLRPSSSPRLFNVMRVASTRFLVAVALVRESETSDPPLYGLVSFGCSSRHFCLPSSGTDILYLARCILKGAGSECCVGRPSALISYSKMDALLPLRHVWDEMLSSYSHPSPCQHHPIGCRIIFQRRLTFNV